MDSNLDLNRVRLITDDRIEGIKSWRQKLKLYPIAN
jgi:hypothetical protein